MKPNFLLKREINKEIEHYRFHLPENSPPFPLHFHSHIEIRVVHSGAVEMTVNDQRRILRDGEIGIAFSYDAHGYRTLADSMAEHLIIPRDYCAEILPLLESKQAATSFISDAEAYKQVSHALNQLSAHPNQLTRRGLIYCILGTISDYLPRETAEEKSPIIHLFPEILIYVSQHFREELPLPMLAKQFGYNPSYLSRGFKENFGISFCDYLTMLRLREAVLLLKNGDASVTKCAMESGFGSMRSFYRAFRAEFGMSPKEYFAQSHESIGE